MLCFLLLFITTSNPLVIPSNNFKTNPPTPCSGLYNPPVCFETIAGETEEEEVGEDLRGEDGG
ncbi:hypothetical protein V6Z11_A02G173800 [Gossypium hirsutum]